MPVDKSNLVNIITSGNNNWCGYFALANCLNFQEKYIRDAAYQGMELTQEAVNNHYSYLLAEYHKGIRDGSTPNPNQERLNELQSQLADKDTIPPETLKEIDELHNWKSPEDNFREQTGFTYKQFEQVKQLYENQDSGGLLEKLEKENLKKNKEQTLGGSYQFFIGSYLQKQFREKWINEFKDQKLQEFLDAQPSDLEHKLKANNALETFRMIEDTIDNSNISIEQIRFLAHKLNPNFNIVIEDQGNKQKFFSPQIAGYYLQQDSEIKKYLIRNLLSSNDAELRSGFVSLDLQQEYNAQTLQSNLEQLSLEAKKSYIYKLFLINLYDELENNQNSNVPEKLNVIIGKYPNIDTNTALEIQNRIQNSLPAKSNKKKLLELLIPIATELDFLISNEKHKSQVKDNLLKDISSLNPTPFNSSDLSTLESYLAQAKSSNRNINLYISNPNVHHYTAQIPQTLYDNFDTNRTATSDQSKTKSLQERTREQQDSTSKTKKTFSKESLNQHSTIYDLYKKYYKIIYDEEFNPSKQTSENELEQILNSFKQKGHLSTILRMNNHEISGQESLKQNTLLHTAISNSDNKDAHTIIKKINETQNLDIYKLQSKGNNPLHLLIAKGNKLDKYGQKLGDFSNSSLAKEIINKADFETLTQETTGKYTALDLAVIRSDFDLIKTLSTRLDELAKTEEEQSQISKIKQQALRYNSLEKDERKKLLLKVTNPINEEIHIFRPFQNAISNLLNQTAIQQKPFPSPQNPQTIQLTTEDPEIKFPKPHDNESAQDYGNRLNNEINSSNSSTYDFYKPKQYRGIGIKTTTEIKDGQITLKIDQVFDGSFAQKELKLDTDYKIVINGKYNSQEKVNKKLIEVTNNIRNFDFKDIRIESTRKGTNGYSMTLPGDIQTTSENFKKEPQSTQFFRKDAKDNYGGYSFSDIENQHAAYQSSTQQGNLRGV